MAEPRLGRAVAALSVVGLAVAGYLTYVHYADVSPICTAGGGCEKVQTSSYAEIAGVPVALLGLIGYAGILVCSRLPGERALLATAVLALVGVGFSAYLTYLELFVIDAICLWCVGSAIVMSLVAAGAISRVIFSPA